MPTPWAAAMSVPMADGWQSAGLGVALGVPVLEKLPLAAAWRCWNTQGMQMLKNKSNLALSERKAFDG